VPYTVKETVITLPGYIQLHSEHHRILMGSEFNCVGGFGLAAAYEVSKTTVC